MRVFFVLRDETILPYWLTTNFGHEHLLTWSGATAPMLWICSNRERFLVIFLISFNGVTLGRRVVGAARYTAYLLCSYYCPSSHLLNNMEKCGYFLVYYLMLSCLLKLIDSTGTLWNIIKFSYMYKYAKTQSYIFMSFVYARRQNYKRHLGITAILLCLRIQ